MQTTVVCAPDHVAAWELHCPQQEISYTPPAAEEQYSESKARFLLGAYCLCTTVKLKYPKSTTAWSSIQSVSSRKNTRFEISTFNLKSLKRGPGAEQSVSLEKHCDLSHLIAQEFHIYRPTGAAALPETSDPLWGQSLKALVPLVHCCVPMLNGLGTRILEHSLSCTRCGSKVTSPALPAG